MSMKPSDSKPTFEQFTAIRRYQPVLAFSPDGSDIAYSVNTSGQYNLWRQSSDGGFPHQVTLSTSQAVRDIAWSPGGRTMLFTADNDGDEFTRVYRVSAKGGMPVVSRSSARSWTGRRIVVSFRLRRTIASQPTRTSSSMTKSLEKRAAL